MQAKVEVQAEVEEEELEEEEESCVMWSSSEWKWVVVERTSRYRSVCKAPSTMRGTAWSWKPTRIESLSSLHRGTGPGRTESKAEPPRLELASGTSVQRRKAVGGR